MQHVRVAKMTDQVHMYLENHWKHVYKFWPELHNRLKLFFLEYIIYKVNFLVLVLVLVDYLAGLQEEHNAKVELSTTNYA